MLRSCRHCVREPLLCHGAQGSGSNRRVQSEVWGRFRSCPERCGRSVISRRSSRARSGPRSFGRETARRCPHRSTIVPALRTMSSTGSSMSESPRPRCAVVSSLGCRPKRLHRPFTASAKMTQIQSAAVKRRPDEKKRRNTQPVSGGDVPRRAPQYPQALRCPALGRRHP